MYQSKSKWLFFFVAASFPIVLPAQPNDWPNWRGPEYMGIVASKNVPLEWSEKKNILWSSVVPGKGNSSPIIVGNRVFLTTADEQAREQSLVCLDSSTGKRLWQAVIHKGKFIQKKNNGCTHASCSPASDGRRVFVSFMNDNAVWTTALDFQGKRLWQKRISGFVSLFGYATSPIVYGNTVIVAMDNKGANRIVALKCKTGDTVWTIKRPVFDSYATPVVRKINGKNQLLISGCKEIASYDPKTGKELWSAVGGAQMSVGSIVTQGSLVFASGGWPERVTLCVRAGSGDMVWHNSAPTYIPSMLAWKGYVYAVVNNGIAYCWDAKTGEQKWKARLGGSYVASPILANGHLLFVNKKGVTKVVKASPEGLDLVGENVLPGPAEASPAVSGNRLFLRSGSRLYCIGK